MAAKGSGTSHQLIELASSSGKPVSGIRPAQPCRFRSLEADRGLLYSSTVKKKTLTLSLSSC